MKKTKLFILGAAFTSLCLMGCNKQPEPEEESNEVTVFLMSGQSNMEGSTYWVHPTKKTKLLENYLDTREDVEFSEIEAGLDNVMTSYYGFYYPNKYGKANSSSYPAASKATAQERLTPNFLPTTVGMGVADNPGKMMGPEVGLAYKLSKNSEATSEKPIYLIKCAFSGSGFEKTDGPNWTNRTEDPDKSLFYLLKTYVNGCLANIEEQGLQPVVKGFLWHQGESDGGNSKYEKYTRTLMKDVREEFAPYARDKDGENIAWIDCTIHDNPNAPANKPTYGDAANNAKLKIANESEDDLNFCVDAGWKTPNGLKLDIGDDAKGGFNTYHYNTKDCYILGEAYADIILNNGILDI